jgi:hypothetical protein
MWGLRYGNYSFLARITTITLAVNRIGLDSYIDTPRYQHLYFNESVFVSPRRKASLVSVFILLLIPTRCGLPKSGLVDVDVDCSVRPKTVAIIDGR